MAKGPDFSRKTADTLAKRAAQLCSNPDCEDITSGPHSEQGKAVNLGEAAHIKGAKPSSSRYDPSMTDKERSDISNGIWLCTGCAKEIDKDAKRFSAKSLHIWKYNHEDEVKCKTKKAYSDSPSREELLRLQRENAEMRQKLQAKEEWNNRKKQYNIVNTEGGAVVYQSTNSPQHYACPRCYEKESIQILQDQDDMAGAFQCPGCKTHFKIKPRKILKLANLSIGHRENHWNKQF